jgi:hypothetical protein
MKSSKLYKIDQKQVSVQEAEDVLYTFGEQCAALTSKEEAMRLALEKFLYRRKKNV